MNWLIALFLFFIFIVVTSWIIVWTDWNYGYISKYQ